MKNKILLLTAFLFSISFAFGQTIASETVNMKMANEPKFPVDENNRNFKVKVTSPYNLKAEDIIAKSKVDFETELKNYDQTVANSVTEFKQKEKDYDVDVIKAKEKFALESAEFKKLSLLERLAMTDQQQNPRLVLPSKPTYYKPQPPVYREPNLKDFSIVDNDVLASQIEIPGFEKNGSYVDINLDIQKANFQDNAGQSYINQPTKMIVKINGVEKANMSFFTEFKFLSSSPTNNINKAVEEKNHLNQVIATINKYLYDNYGYVSKSKLVSIKCVKNKGKFDDLVQADIYVKTNIKKIDPQDSEITKSALTNMQKGIDIWKDTLTKIDYKDPKADFNSKIAQYIYFNLMYLSLALDNKKEAEKYLNEFQDHQVYMKLSTEDKTELSSLENMIYKKK